MTWPAVKRAFLQEEFAEYVKELTWSKWRPNKIVWHNTAAPSLAQWIKSANDDLAARRVPGITRITNLESFFRNNNGWSGCPHLFIANDLIWVMNPLTAPGVHSPSWNGTSIGIEMIGDFDREDCDTGEGLRVKQNTIFATAILCDAIGLEPATSIYLHKQDPKTTHKCPGDNIAKEKDKMILAVSGLMSGGDHDPHASTTLNGTVPAEYEQWVGLTTTNGLSFRTGPGVSNRATSSLPKGVRLTVIDEAKNDTTVWLRVKTPAGYTGWVSGSFVERIKA